MAKKIFKEKAKRFVKKVLEEPEIRDYVVKELSLYFPDKKKTEDHLDRLYQELVKLREEQELKWGEQRSLWEEQNKRWEEQNKRWEEQNKRWEEQNKRWEEQNKRWEEQQAFNRQILEEIKKLHRKYEAGIGALGARWGLRAESSFREAIKGILEEDFPVKVERYVAYDPDGEVFGRPDQIELDLIIRDGKTIVAEIKSSMSKSDVYTFKKKVDLYMKKEGKRVDRVLIISPMVDSKAMELIKDYGFEVFTYPDNIEEL